MPSAEPRSRKVYGSDLAQMSNTLTVRAFLRSHDSLAYKNVCLLSQHTFAQLFPHKSTNQPATVRLFTPDHRHSFFYNVKTFDDKQVPDTLDIYLNEVQCHNLMVRPGDTIEFTVEEISFPEASSIRFSVFIPQDANRQAGVVGSERITESAIDGVIKNTLLQHILTEGQSISIQAADTTLQLVVSTCDAPPIQPHGLTMEETLIRQNMLLQEPQPLFVTVGAETLIEYKNTKSFQVLSKRRQYDFFLLC